MKKVLLISTNDNAPSYSNRTEVLKVLQGHLTELSIQTDIVMLEDLLFVIIGNNPSIILPNGNDINEYDLVYIKNWRAHEGVASAITTYVHHIGNKVICSELDYFRATDKIIEAFMLVTQGIPYPDTLFTLQSNLLSKFIKDNSKTFEFPLVVKAIDGSAGEDNYLAKNEEELQRILTDSPNTSFMVQNMIENDGDHRIVIMGGAPVLAFKRTRTSNDTHLNNTSKGAVAELVALDSYSEGIISDAVKAATILRREIAGADILIDKQTGKHVILEVNASPQLSTGAFLDEKKVAFQNYIRKELEKA